MLVRYEKGPEKTLVLQKGSISADFSKIRETLKLNSLAHPDVPQNFFFGVFAFFCGFLASKVTKLSISPPGQSNLCCVDYLDVLPCRDTECTCTAMSMPAFSPSITLFSWKACDFSFKKWAFPCCEKTRPTRLVVPIALSGIDELSVFSVSRHRIHQHRCVHANF